MNEQWITVARGLKCLSISIALFFVAVVLALAAQVVKFILIGSGIAARPPGTMLLLPAGVVASVAFIFSRIARLLLLWLPSEVPNGRFYAMASLFLELLGQTIVGAYVSAEMSGFRLPDDYHFPLIVAISLISCAGWICFQRTLSKIAGYTACRESQNHLALLWIQFVFGAGLLFFGCGYFMFSDDSAIKLFSVVSFFGSLLLFSLAIRNYFRTAIALRLSIIHAGLCSENRP